MREPKTFRSRSRWALLAVIAVAAVWLVARPAPSEGGTIAVAGDFILWDTFPALSAGELCDAKRSLYHDINSDTKVQAETVDGHVLARTSLGDGVVATTAELAALFNTGERSVPIEEVQDLLDDIGMQPCVFMFSFDIESGSDGGAGYVVRFGRRGRWHLTEDELRRPGQLQWSVGLR